MLSAGGDNNHGVVFLLKKCVFLRKNEEVDNYTPAK